MPYTKPTTDLKFKTVINKNTFYFFNPAFEEKYEGYLNSLKEILLILKNEIETIPLFFHFATTKFDKLTKMLSHNINVQFFNARTNPAFETIT